MQQGASPKATRCRRGSTLKLRNSTLILLMCHGHRICRGLLLLMTLVFIMVILRRLLAPVLLGV